MKKMGLVIAGLLFAASSSANAADDKDQHAAATGSQETVKIMVVDKTRKPFKRTFETYTVAEIAAMEEASTDDVSDSRDRLSAKRINWR